MQQQVTALAGVLGSDVWDLIERCEPAAQRLAAELLDSDRRLAAETAITLAPLIPTDAPGWWTSPLGQAVAQTYDTGEASIPEVCDVLSIGRARVYQLLDSGKLERGPAGGITWTSVGARMTRQLDMGHSTDVGDDVEARKRQILGPP